MNTPQQAIPLWQNILSILGFSSLIGSIFGHWLSSRRERSKWISENKKAEWRELIDRLDESLTAMSYAFVTTKALSSDETNNPLAGIGKGNRALHDRIFIADAVKKYGIVGKWKELVQYTSAASDPRSPSQRGGPTAVGFDAKAREFQEEVLRFASCFWQVGLAHFGGLIWPTLGTLRFRG
jgi:hypothetical protein